MIDRLPRDMQVIILQYGSFSDWTACRGSCHSLFTASLVFTKFVAAISLIHMPVERANFWVPKSHSKIRNMHACLNIGCLQFAYWMVFSTQELWIRKSQRALLASLIQSMLCEAIRYGDDVLFWKLLQVCSDTAASLQRLCRFVDSANDH
jgi:hypothetical protein